MIAALIGVMIAIVVGVSLMPVITSIISEVETTAEASGQPLSSGMSAMLDILPIIFATVVVLGAVAWIGGNGEGIPIPLPHFKRREGRDLYIYAKKQSEALDEYRNNLDDLIGITTISYEGESGVYGLRLTPKTKELKIDPRYHWFLVDKAKDAPLFKIVGFNKKDWKETLVYILGKGEKGPFLLSIPNNRLQDPSWMEDNQKKWLVSGEFSK